MQGVGCVSTLGCPQEGELPNSATVDPQTTGQAAFQLVASLLDALDRPLLVSDRRGKVLFTNFHAQDALTSEGLQSKPDLNLFKDILRTDCAGIMGQLEAGEQEISLPLELSAGKSRARIRWLPEPDWLVVYVEPSPHGGPRKRSRDASDRTRPDAGTGNYLSKSSGGVPAASRGKPAEDCFSRIRRA